MRLLLTARVPTQACNPIFFAIREPVTVERGNGFKFLLLRGSGSSLLGSAKSTKQGYMFCIVASTNAVLDSVQDGVGENLCVQPDFSGPSHHPEEDGGL